MEELIKFPWGKVFAHFVWIFGASLMLADFSYHEFLAHQEKASLIKVLKKSSFKRPFYWGLLLIAIGACLSIGNPLLAGISGGAAFLLIIIRKRYFQAIKG